MDDLGSAIESLSFGLVAITARAIDQAAPGRALTFQQWRIVVVLGTAPDGSRVRDVAARIGASGPSTSRLAHRLATRGLVRRTEDQRDRRAVRLHLTEAGADLRRQVIEARRDLIRTTIADLSPDADLASRIADLAVGFQRWI